MAIDTATPENSPCFVYILHLVDRTHYTGLTQNMNRRMREHQEGQSRSTRLKLPVTLIFLVRLETRKQARTLEKRIKGRGAKRWLDQLKFSPLKYEYDIVEDTEQYNRDKKESVINEKK